MSRSAVCSQYRGERHLQRQEVGREVDQLLRVVINARGKPGGSGSGNHRDGGVIGCRLKQSGMFSMVRGANAILALGCCYLGGRFEDYWEAHRAHLHFCVAHTRGWAQSCYRRSALRREPLHQRQIGCGEPRRRSQLEGSRTHPERAVSACEK